MVWIIVIVVIVVLLLLFFIAQYNGLVRLKNRVENAWAQIDVQLRRSAPTFVLSTLSTMS